MSRFLLFPFALLALLVSCAPLTQSATIYAATDGLALYVLHMPDVKAGFSGTLVVTMPQRMRPTTTVFAVSSLALQGNAIQISRKGRLCSTWLVSVHGSRFTIRSRSGNVHYNFRKVNQRTVDAFLRAIRAEASVGGDYNLHSSLLGRCSVT